MRISKARNIQTRLFQLRFAEGQEQEMLAAKRSVFFYTLEEDERKCLASIERIDQNVWKRKKDIRGELRTSKVISSMQH
ncbi:MAG: hypothetical protein JRN52_07295 [Nitrososphaerota archaeon]|nr:hypothetical protein [Nitrososphaerota archaeon]